MQYLTPTQAANTLVLLAQAFREGKTAERFAKSADVLDAAAKAMTTMPPAEQPPITPDPIPPPVIEPPIVVPPEMPPSETPWPDGTSTGPRQSTTAAINGDAFTQRDGQIIERTEILGRLYVRHRDVVVRDSIIRGDSDAGGGNGWYCIQNEAGGNSNMLVEYCEIGKTGSNTVSVGVQLGAGTLRNCNIHNVSDGVQASGGATITDNWIHSLYSFRNDAHIDSLQMFSGAGNTSITGNYMDCTDHSSYKLLPNGSIFFQGNFDPVTIEGNMLIGGGYLLRLEAGVRNASVTNNHFKLTDSRGWGNVLVQGHIAAWADNIDDRTNQLVPKP